MDFKEQILEDIREYQKEFPNIQNIHKNEWAFNFWILDKLFNEDEDLIETKIIDYHDMGVDCYEIFEESEDIYLIQNKFYSDTTSLSKDYIENDFLLRPLNALRQGTYRKSQELQNAYNKYKEHPNFMLHLHLYVTNNLKVQGVEDFIKQFNANNPKCIAKIFYLDDIKEQYYGELFQVKKHYKTFIHTKNNGTVLNVLPKDYKLNIPLTAKYVFAPVVSVFKMYQGAKENNYPIFDMNIREFLGQTGVNKKIYNTLMNKNERHNFFYYNNGITIICDKIGTTETKNTDIPNADAIIEINNPQIVNGCQTVNSIYEALKNIDPLKLNEEFADTFVMLKILEIDKDDESEKDLYNNIVRYTNSQNSIDDKTFTANNDIFKRIQSDFEARGFLLLIKQSDKNSFKEKYKVITQLKSKNTDRLSRFGLSSMKKVDDCFIPLDKMLQVFISFMNGGQDSFVKKNKILKSDSYLFEIATDFCKSVTTDTLLDLFLLYKKAEVEKKASGDKRTPIPYYLIDAFAKYECKERKKELISVELSDSAKISKLIKLYTMVCSMYAKQYGTDYNNMIKKEVDYKLLEDARNVCSTVL